jgi:Cd2+/Zn2+-exporting ATPase
MDLAALLTEIGLTEYEAKVYLELLKDYPVSGYKLAKEGGVPRSMVYEALGRLVNRGAILETREDRVTLYRPIPPDVLLDLHLEAQTRLAATLRAELTSRYSYREEDHLWSMTGNRSVTVYAFQMIRQAQRKIVAVLSDVTLVAVRAELAKAHERGVEVYALLTGELELEFGTTVHHPAQESELQKMAGMAMLAVDDAEVLIANTPMPPVAETTATITRNRNLLFISTQFIWMEMFTQRILQGAGKDLLAGLSPQDRLLFGALLSSPEPFQEKPQ